MTIHINGQAYPLANDTKITIGSALELYFSESQKISFAVALNGDFVSRDSYETTLVNNGDSLDVLLPIQGG